MAFELRQVEYQNRKVPDQFDIYYNNVAVGTLEWNRDRGKQNIMSATLRSRWGGVAVVPHNEKSILEWMVKEIQEYGDNKDERP